MNEAQIRRVLNSDLQWYHRNEAGTIAVSELPIYYGDARADLCVVNGELVGYEIKSVRDSVARLERQTEFYRQVFDRLHYVVAEKHLHQTTRRVPDFAGISVVSIARDRPVIENLRPAAENADLTPMTLATLLWRDEALAVCEKFGFATGIRSKPRRDLWARLASELSIKDLRDEVRAALKGRLTWDRLEFRIAPTPRKCGD